MSSAAETASASPHVAPVPRPGLALSLILDLAYLLLMVPVSLYHFYTMIFKKKHRQSHWGQWGVGLDAALRDYPGGGIWIHAISVGEARAAQPVVAAIRKHHPNMPIFISTTTETGQATARGLFSDCKVWWFPWDISFVIARWMRRVRPELVIILENDLWPNFVRSAVRRGTPVTMINGKISDRTSRRYQRLLHSPLASLVKVMWGGISALCVQTGLDRERIVPLVGDASRVHVTGNVKFDFPPPQISVSDQEQWRKHIGLVEGQPVIVAGSTHGGEERVVLQAFQRVRTHHPNCHLLVVPRHPERFDEVTAFLAESDFSVQRWSQSRGDRADITVVDQMGLLTGLYSIATVAVVCGSFTKIGGHNILEPAQFGIPVIYGPHMHAQRGMKRILERAKGGLQVEASDLGPAIDRLLADPEERHEVGEAARSAVLNTRGSAERSVDVVRVLLG